MDNADDLFDQLLAIAAVAHARGQHELAYHVLAAALHAAIGDDDDEEAAEVVDRARATRDVLQQRAPAHRLVTPGPGGQSPYDQLITQAGKASIRMRTSRPDDPMVH